MRRTDGAGADAFFSPGGSLQSRRDSAMDGSADEPSFSTPPRARDSTGGGFCVVSHGTTPADYFFAAFSLSLPDSTSSHLAGSLLVNFVPSNL